MHLRQSLPTSSSCQQTSSTSGGNPLCATKATWVCPALSYSSTAGRCGGPAWRPQRMDEWIYCLRVSKVRCKDINELRGLLSCSAASTSCSV